jgi:hypothetical protein
MSVARTSRSDAAAPCARGLGAWEGVGQVPNAVFPSGRVANEVGDEGFVRASAVVRLHEGATDTTAWGWLRRRLGRRSWLVGRENEPECGRRTCGRVRFQYETTVGAGRPRVTERGPLTPRTPRDPCQNSRSCMLSGFPGPTGGSGGRQLPESHVDDRSLGPRFRHALL